MQLLLKEKRHQFGLWGFGTSDMIAGMRIPEIAVERYPSNGIEVSLTKHSNDHWGNS